MHKNDKKQIWLLFVEPVVGQQTFIGPTFIKLTISSLPNEIKLLLDHNAQSTTKTNTL
jgi:hypothetical protein